jgi:hypothetical protein
MEEFSEETVAYEFAFFLNEENRQPYRMEFIDPEDETCENTEKLRVDDEPLISFSCKMNTVDAQIFNSLVNLNFYMEDRQLMRAIGQIAIAAFNAGTSYVHKK